MSEWLNGIFECLDINSSTGLATEDSVQSMSPFQRLFVNGKPPTSFSRPHFFEIIVCS